MNEDLKLLYRELGYTGSFPERVTYRGGVRSGRGSGEEKLPPLDKKNLDGIEEQLKKDPRSTLAVIKKELQDKLSDDQIHSALTELKSAFGDPQAYVSKLQVEKRAREKEHPLPTRTTRGGDNLFAELLRKFRQYPGIVVEPGNIKYEPRNDALGWAINTGVFWLQNKLNISIEKAPFPYHDAGFASGFKYRLKDQQDKPLGPQQKITLALFADWGTGLYHSKFIAKRIEKISPHYAIHLGDVYYAGRNSEFESNFRKPLAPILKTSRVFTMNANHEMYSGGFPYFAYVNEKHLERVGQVPQEQEGSYFCLWNEKYQIIGIDTAYHEDGRHKDPTLQRWLGECLREGKTSSPGRVNILLTPNDPYELGKEQFKDLLNDLHPFTEEKLIDFWFWGNTHYAALFDRSEQTPFIGSCIGHGGHPIYRKDIVEAHQKHQELLSQRRPLPRTLWVELTPKFPEITGNLRPELGNHGFCLMELHPNAIRLIYYDWLNEEERFSIEFPT